MTHPHRLVAFFAVFFLLGDHAVSTANAGDDIKIGILAELSGPYRAYGMDAMRGAEMALAEFNGHAGSKPVNLVFENTENPSSEIAERAQNLIGEAGAQLIIGPQTGSDGKALKEFARTVPAVTFINGASAARDLTLLDPAQNFFRFTTDAAQWMAGLGHYAYTNKGYRRVVTLGEKFSFPYTQVMSFLVEFCSMGGRTAETFWLPLSDKPFDAVSAKLASIKADAIFIALDGGNTAEFLEHYWQSGGKLPIIGGSSTFDPALLNTNSIYHARLPGSISAAPLSNSDESSAWKEFARIYHQRYPEITETPSIFAFNYYINTKAALLALQEADGDLTDGQRQIREELAELSFETPTGRVSLDENRQAIANNLIIEIVLGNDKRLQQKVVKTVTSIDQTLGLGRERYLALGVPGPRTPSCP